MNETGWLTTAIVAVVAVATVMIVAIIKGRSADLTVDAKDLGKITLKIGAEEKSAVTGNLAAAAEARHEQPPAAPPQVPDKIRFARILWIDDLPKNNVFEMIALQRLGLPITVATDGDMALEYLKHDPYELVITDLSRPHDEMSVKEAIEGIRRTRPDLPVVAYTSAWGASKPEAKDLGLTAVTTSPDKLFAAVVSALT